MTRAAYTLTAGLLSIALTGCGHKGPLIAPTHAPVAPADQPTSSNTASSQAQLLTLPKHS